MSSQPCIFYSASSLSFCMESLKIMTILFSIVYLVYLLLVVALQPYKNRMAHLFQSYTLFRILFVMFYINITALNRSSYGATTRFYLGFYYIVNLILGIMPLVSIFGLIVYWVLLRCRSCLRLFQWCKRYVSIIDDGADA